MEFQKACTEVNYIINNLSPDERMQIPQSMIDFFSDNRDLFYKVNYDVSKPLYEQKLLEETKALLHIIYYKYFMPEDNKSSFIDYMDNQRSDLIPNYYENMKFHPKAPETALVLYKENIFTKLFNKFKSIFKKKV